MSPLARSDLLCRERVTSLLRPKRARFYHCQSTLFGESRSQLRSYHDWCKQYTSHVTFFSCLSAIIMMSHTTWAQVFVRVISSMSHALVCLISFRPCLRTLHLSLSHLLLHLLEGRNAKLKERQKWSNEEPKLDNARDYEEFISLTLRIRNSKRPLRMPARNWKHRWPLLL